MRLGVSLSRGSNCLQPSVRAQKRPNSGSSCNLRLDCSGFTANTQWALEQILWDVRERRHAGCDLLSGPTKWLLEELELEVIDAQGAQVPPTEVENFIHGAQERRLASHSVN